MSLYVIVSADFPKVQALQRIKIYNCLDGKMWMKIKSTGGTITTVWYKRFKEISYPAAILITKKNLKNAQNHLHFQD